MTTNRDSLIVLAIQYNSMVPKEDAAIALPLRAGLIRIRNSDHAAVPVVARDRVVNRRSIIIGHLVRFLREHGLVETLAVAVGLWALGLGARMIDVLYREIESRDSPSSRF
jgi:hypothetical protein